MNYLTYRYKLYRFNKWREKTDNKFKKQIVKLGKEGKKHGDKEYDELIRDGSFNYEIDTAEINELITNYLASKAKRMFLPVPPKPTFNFREPHEDNLYWRFSNFLSDYYLTNEGITNLRNLIAEHQKQSHCL